MYRRILDLSEALKRNSIFLFGPRQTGKSTLLRTVYPDARYVDLLEANTFRELTARPERLRQSLKSNETFVIVDEIQKLPSLLDEIQLLIDRNKSLRFVLTGSSARKLKRGAANLLGGRAVWQVLHPLVSAELGYDRVDDMLKQGGLPTMIDSPTPHLDLKNYASLYLKEEIQAEGLVRSIENFSRFFEVAALSNGQQINFSKTGADCAVPPRTVREYFQILEDTLLGYMVQPLEKTVKRKPVATSKFYFFDVGVANALLDRNEIRSTSEHFGRTLEHLVFVELRAYLDYRQLDQPLRFWRAHHSYEVDFVVGTTLAIEVKATRSVDRSDTRGLSALGEEVKLKDKIIVCNEPWERTTDEGIKIMPYKIFFQKLWSNEILN